MNFVLEDHEENDDEVIREETTRNSPFSPSSSCATSKYKTQEPATNFDKKLELLDLSLGGNNNEYQPNIGSSSSSRSIEKEHMFDKVVTPSDVGKLNRLVIPKQQAEKYFPLDSSSNEKGLLLNFEDRNGKSWRFRYSYWNSSQSYVMTKGWSRFVKDKKLDAGDTVSFQRGVGESRKDSRYYIDWRRRPNVPDPTTLAHIQLQSQFNYPQSVRWRSLYSVPQTSMCMSRNYEPLHRLNYNIYPYSHRHHHHHQQQQQQQQLQHQQAISYGNVGQYYHPKSSSSGSQHHRQIGAVPVQYGRGDQPMVIDSVPIVLGTKETVAKRLRLFGVNMECPTQDGSSSSFPRATIGSDESLHFSNNSNNNSPQSGM